MVIFFPSHCKFIYKTHWTRRMNLTDYYAKYYAYELTKRCASDNIEKPAGAVASAQVDLNPRQVDAALFAFLSPLSKGPSLQMKQDWAKPSTLDWCCLRSGLSKSAMKSGVPSSMHRTKSPLREISSSPKLKESWCRTSPLSYWSASAAI
jgi:hypothetical protein